MNCFGSNLRLIDGFMDHIKQTTEIRIRKIVFSDTLETIALQFAVETVDQFRITQQRTQDIFFQWGILARP